MRGLTGRGLDKKYEALKQDCFFFCFSIHSMQFYPFISDINECNVDPTLCKHGRCSNLFGSYKCACDPGFTPGRSLQTCQGKLIHWNAKL